MNWRELSRQSHWAPNSPRVCCKTRFSHIFQKMTEVAFFFFFNVKYPDFSILITNPVFKKHSGPNKTYLSSFSAQPHSRPIEDCDFCVKQRAAECPLWFGKAPRNSDDSNSRQSTTSY